MAKFTVNFKPDTFLEVEDANAVWLPDDNDRTRLAVINGGLPIYIQLDGHVELIKNLTTDEVVYDDGRRYGW